MAEDVVVELNQTKPCCALLKDRFTKLEVKRNALRQAVKLLELEIEKLQAENLNLKKSYEEQRSRAELERELKEKESDFNSQLEKDICILKSEISLLQKKRSSKAQDEGGTGQLETRVLEQEAEINRLKELLEKEKNRGDSEKKKAEAEKKKAAEAWKQVKAEKSKVEEEKRLANIEKNKAEEYRVSLETFKIESKEAREKMIIERSKVEEANRRIEAEKKRANREKKHIDSAMAKAEEQRKCAEADRKKAIDEKTRADNLTQQLMEERKRTEALQKEIQSKISAGQESKDLLCSGASKCHSVVTDGNMKTRTENQALKGKLRVAKKQVKLAKRMAKLEKAQKNLLREELLILKQDAVQFSRRLNVLDDCFSYGIEGIGLTKTGDSSKLRSFNLKNQVSGIEACDLHCQSENKLAKTTNALDCFGQTIERTGSLPPISGGSCTKLSGISSEMESLFGGSVRNTSQNSAMYSTTALFSDRRLVGSQGKCFSSIPRSSKLAEENPKQSSVIAKLCDEATKMRQNESLGMLAESNDGNLVSRKSENPCLTSTLNDRKRNADRMTGHSRKKRRIHDSLESVIHLYSEDKKLHLQMEDGLSALHDILILKDNQPACILPQRDGYPTPLGNERSLVSQPLDKSNSKSYQFSKKKKVAKKHKLVSQLCHQNGKKRHKDKLEIGGSVEVLFHTGTTPSTKQIRETVQCADETADAFGSDQATLVCCERKFDGDYLKLLELDDPADEERYRMAMEMPVSPTLPEINFPIPEVSETDNVNYLAETGLCRGSEIEEDNLLPSSGLLDVVDIEIDSNKLNFKVLDSPMGRLSHKIAGSVHLDEEAIGSNMNMSHSDFKKNHILCDNEHVSSILETDAPVAVKQISEARKFYDSVHNIHHSSSVLELEGSRGQSRPSLQCSADAEVIPKAKEVNNIISVETDISLSSGNVNYGLSKSGLDSVSYLQKEPTQNYGPGNFSLVGNTISPLKEPNEEFVTTTQAIESVSSKHKVEGKGKISEDLFVSQSVNDYPLLLRTKSSNDEDYLLNATATQTSLYQVLESGSEMEVAKPMPILSIEEPKVHNDGHLHHISKYCVVFSNTIEKGSIFRIFHATETCISRCSMFSQTDGVVATALLALSLEQDLLPEEKACVFFSLLLHNYSVVALANSRSFMSGHSSLCSDSFAGQINKVLADAETRCLFLDLCRLDILLSLIEDFLIDRSVIAYSDGLYEPVVPCDSNGELFLLDGEKMFLSYRTATVDQLVAGSIILASICEAVDHVGFLCEASYNILRTCKGDSFWNNLMMVHIFVSICGKKYFDLTDYSLVITAIKSVVSFLEKRDELVGNIPPCLPSVNDNQHLFSPCTQCPFAEGAVCVDNVILLLLEKLQGYAVSGIRDENLKKSITKAIFTPPLTERSEGFLEHESDLDGLSINCDKFYSLKNRRVVAPKSNCVADTISCFFSDIASVVELLACYISWDWTYTKIIPCLLKMLEPCVIEEFSAAILTLVGQLGRLGVDAGGYNHNGIEELRCNLSVFLDLKSAGKWGLPTQLASVNSLIGLLSLEVGELFQNNSVLPLDSNQAVHAMLIRRWFSELTKEQQSQILNLFLSADVQKN